MPRMHVRCEVQFCAAARLWREDWSEDRNLQTYGICASPHGHGHDYRLTVEVAGEVDAETGMVLDYMVLKELVDARVVQPVDHRNLNVDVPFLHGQVPTSENLLAAFWPRIAGELPESTALHALHLREGRDDACSYYGPDHD